MRVARLRKNSASAGRPSSIRYAPMSFHAFGKSGSSRIASTQCAMASSSWPFVDFAHPR
jgi:hypothetical protein